MLGVVAAPVVARADGGTGGTLYVAKSSACSDSGSGTQAVPFCTVQAAVTAAGPGDTVMLEGRSTAYAGTVSVTGSGTAAAPITITSQYPAFEQQPKIQGISVSGASHVVVRGIEVLGSVTVSGSQDVTLDGLYVQSPQGSDGVHLSGDSSDVTVSRDWVFSDRASAVGVDPGATGTVITTDLLESPANAAGTPILSVDGAPGTDVVSNTLGTPCAGSDLDLTGGSVNSVVENNVFTPPSPGTTASCTSPIQTGMEVSADSVSGTTADYNDIYSPDGGSLYTWGGTGYASPAAFTAATGQGSHDLASDPEYVANGTACSVTPTPEYGSPVIDSADSLAPGELSTDINGAPRIADVPTGGTGPDTDGYDRGAVQRPVCLTMDQEYTQLWWNNTHEVMFQPMVDSLLNVADSYTVNWGDGTSTTDSSYTGTQPTIVHTYPRAGSYQLVFSETADGQTATYTRPVTPSGSDYVPLAPQRLLDTRNGTGTGGATTPVAAHSTVRLQVAQGAGLPTGPVTAAVLNVTATDATAAGYLSGYGDGGSSSTSFLNYPRGGTVANQVTVPVAANGYVDFYNGSSGTVHVIADLQGYYTQSAAAGYLPAAPKRLLDTRTTSAARHAGQVPAKGTVTVQIAGADGIPATGVTAVVLNTTETDATAAGFVTAYPGGTALPTASNLDFTAGSTVPNLITVPVGSDGTVTLYNGSGRPVDLIADLQGYYQQGEGLSFVPEQTRLYDSRSANGTQGPPLDEPMTPGLNLSLGVGESLVVRGRDGSYNMPEAALLNTTVTGPKAAGFLSLTPTESSAPATSNVNFTAGETVANADVATTGSNGWVWVHNGSKGGTEVIVDVEGYFA